VGFPDRLRQLREEQGLHQKDVALRLGFEPQSISHYETGYRVPSIKTLEQLCDLFGVTADYLLGRSDYRSYPSTDLMTVTNKLLADIQKATQETKDMIKETGWKDEEES